MRIGMGEGGARRYILSPAERLRDPCLRRAHATHGKPFCGAPCLATTHTVTRSSSSSANIVLSVCSVYVAPKEGVTCVSSSISSSESALLDGGSKPGVHLGVLLQDVGRLADDLAKQRVDVVLEVGLDLGLLFN